MIRVQKPHQLCVLSFGPHLSRKQNRFFKYSLSTVYLRYRDNRKLVVTFVTSFPCSFFRRIKGAWILYPAALMDYSWICSVVRLLGTERILQSASDPTEAQGTLNSPVCKASSLPLSLTSLLMPS